MWEPMWKCRIFEMSRENLLRSGTSCFYQKQSEYDSAKGETQVIWWSQKWKTVGQLLFIALPDIVSYYGCEGDLVWLIKHM